MAESIHAGLTPKAGRSPYSLLDCIRISVFVDVCPKLGQTKILQHFYFGQIYGPDGFSAFWAGPPIFGMTAMVGLDPRQPSLG